MKDDEIVKLIKEREVRGIELLIDRYGAYVGTVVRRILLPALSESDAEEIAADVFTTVWLSPEKLDPDNIRRFLAAVSRNKAVSRLRKKQPFIPLDDDIVIVGESLENETDRRLLAHELEKALGEMERSDREILIDTYYYCRRLSEIAKKLDISENAAKTRLCRARSRLKKILEERGFVYEN